MSSTTFVDRACWIGNVENEIYLHPGDTAYVLLGIPKNDELITYRNPNKVASGGWPSHDQFLLEVKIPLFANAHIAGEISIIAHENHKATTLITRTFAIQVSENKFSLSI